MAEPSRYQLLRTIASGGMATVYEAVARGERGFERRVAVKRVLPQHAGDESVRRMFFDEARIASRLHHAGIVQVLDYGVVDGDDFIVMEHVDGVDAERAVDRAMQRGEGMGEGLALHVTAEVAHALDHAHRLTGPDGGPLGIVHRDVSPHNVLLSWEGDVKLSDFGIALATQREEQTRTGVVKGKMSYMPLEQAAGERVTAAADVYALGATLHTLLAGGPPSDDPRRAPELDPSLSPEARDLVARCMAREPGDRPTAEEVALRAGQLAASRLSRDARGALREWLAPLREATGKVKALDDLMGLALVQSGEGRRFTVSREPPVAPGRPSAAPTGAVTPSAGRGARAGERGTEPSIRLPTTLRPGALVGIGLVAAAAVALAVMGLDLGGPDTGTVAADQSPPPEPEAIADPPRGVVASERDDSRRGVAAAAPEAPEAQEAEPPAPLAKTAGRPRRRAERPAAAPPPPREESPAPDEPAPEPAEPVTTWLRVPRGSAGQERVVVDGAPRGFTPAVLRVAAGEHRVVIEDAETGAVLLERAVTTADHHTRTAPLVLSR